MRIASLAFVSLLLILSGCMSVPSSYVGKEIVKGALVSTDGKLYLLGNQRSAVFDAAPFRVYRELMDNPLKEAVACARLNYHTEAKGNDPAKTVRGSYGMLLQADRVTPEQAAQFGLQRLDVGAINDPATVPERYLRAADPACGLPTEGGRYPGVMFEGDGTWVYLPDVFTLIEEPLARAYRGAAGGESRLGTAVQAVAGGGWRGRRGGYPGISGFHPVPRARSLEVT